MAVKTKAQVLTLWQQIAEIKEDFRVALQGEFATNIAAVRAAIEAGDDQPEDQSQLAALDVFEGSLERAWSSVRALVRTMHTTLGRYAASRDLADEDANLSAFFSNLISAAESVESRGFTLPASFAADGGNKGNARVAIDHDDVGGRTVDHAHVETLTLRVVRDSHDETLPGEESLRITGSASSDQPYRQGGTASGGERSKAYGEGVDDWSTRAGEFVARHGGEISVVGGASDRNLIENGDFESAQGSGVTKISGWSVFSGSDANVAVDTTQKVHGSQSIKFDANVGLKHVWADGAGPLTLVRHFRNIKVRRDANLTAGSLVMRVRDDDTVHVTETLDLFAGLVANTWTEIPAVITSGFFTLPKTVGKNLRFELEITGLAGAGATVFVDECVIMVANRYDVGHAIAVARGIVDVQENDRWTAAITSTDIGLLQITANEDLGGGGYWLPHAGTAVGWPDV